MSKLIQYPRAKYWDTAWNPVIGCKPCSPACEHCYAKAWAERFGQSFEPHPSKKQTPPRKGVVFCGNMTDLFGEWNIVHERGGYYHKACDWIAKALDHDKRNPYKDKATYLWLTKRADLMAEWVSDGGWETDWTFDDVDCMDFKDCDMSNQFFGVTAENWNCWNERWEHMKKLPAWVNWWISAEPLLGPMYLGLPYMQRKNRPKWVVVGCESGPNRRPCGMGWVESIVGQCQGVGVPVFVKQLDIGGKCVTDIEKFPEHLRIRQVPWAKEGGAK